MRKCTDLQSCQDWTPAFIGPCCRLVPPVQNLPPQSNQEKHNIPSFKVLQFNCNGIIGKIDEILKFMNDNEIKLAAIQETKLNEKSQFPSIKSGYTILRKDRVDAGGGLAFIIENSVLYKTTSLPTPRNND